jgi:tetratricopeptide (TPR) repeat protein/CHAT domain-containing protein
MRHYRKIAGGLCVGLLAIGGGSSPLCAQNPAGTAPSEQSDVHGNDAQRSQSTPEARWRELNTLVSQLRDRSKYLEALPFAQKSVELAKLSFGADDPRLATSLNNLALVYDDQNKYSEAEPLYEQALRIDQKALGPDHPSVAADLNNLAGLYREQGKYGEAEQLYKKALEIYKKALGSNHPDVALSLNYLAGLYRVQGNFGEAEPLYQQALAIRKRTLGPDHPDVAVSLNNLALLYDNQGKYAEAEPLYNQALEITRKALGPDHPDVVVGLTNLALLYKEQGKYSEAEPFYQQALAIRKRTLGPDHPDVAVSLNNLALLYNEQGKYNEAEPLYQQALRIDQKALGPDDPGLAIDLNNLAVLYREQGQYEAAEPFFARSMAIWQKALGPDHPLVATSLNNLAGLYKTQGKYDAAEPLYQHALAIRKKALGPDHPDVAASLNNLAELYREQGKYAETEPLYQQALAIWKKALGPDHPVVATSLNNLAVLYQQQGKYGEAEPLYQQALAITKKALGPDHLDVALRLNNLAALYGEQGKYSEAEPLYQQALAIRERVLKPDHPDVASSLNNLAELYREQGKYAEAEPLYKQALEIRKKALGPDHPDVALSLNTLGRLYDDQGKYAEAEPLLKQALEVDEKALGPDHPDLADILNNLAGLYDAQGKYGEAEPLYQQALAIDQKALGPDHLDVALNSADLAMLYYGWNHPEQAETNFDSNFQILHKVIEKQFAYMSEKERLGFLGTVQGIFPVYFSFIYSYPDPSSVGKMYDLLLWEKGMVASSVSAMRAKIAASGDQEAVSLLDRIAQKRTQVARITANPPVEAKSLEQARDQIAELEQQANDLERELVQRSPTVAQERTSAQVSWEDVRAKLKTGEAAVEYMRYKFHDGKHWTGKSYYAALVITPATKIAPTFIPLGDAATLECGPINNYRQLVGMNASCLPCSVPTDQQGVRSHDGSPTAMAALNTPTFYEAFWKPLELALGNAKRIYFSTDGVLSQVSLVVVPDGSGKLLIEKYDLRPVISTKDLLREPHPTGEQTAALIGDPKFTATIAEQQTALAALSKPYSPQRQFSAGGVEVASNAAPLPVRGGGRRSFDLHLTWPDLPSTKIEVQQLNKLLTKPWQVEMYTGAEALEEVMKRLHGPRLLHVATHGFFLADENQPQACSGGVSTRTGAPANAPDALQRPLKEDPMLRSGLVFTGANRIANGDATPEGMDDGILTAYEAMGLNLEGTELVVLSACETGLGQTKAGEGVFGLRRALQVAGAQSVMMTMWEVPDVETQKLMKLFYGKWLSGEEKHQALREAQLELREQIKKNTGRDSPQKWGAFVLLGP